MATQEQIITTTAVDIVDALSLEEDANYTLKNESNQDILFHVGSADPGEDGAWASLDPKGTLGESAALVTIGDPIWVRTRSRTARLIVLES